MPWPRQDAMYRRDGDRCLMEAVQVRRDLARPEVIVLPQVENLADDLTRGRSRRPQRRARTVAQAGAAVLGVTPLPFVEGLARNPESPAHTGDVPLVGGLPQHQQPPRS